MNARGAHSAKHRRGDRPMPWLLAALALALTLFPGYIGALGGGPQTTPGVSPEGHWLAKDVDQNGQEFEIILDIGWVGTRWAGEFDLPEYGVENYPVEVTVTDSVIVLGFTAMNVDFTGTLSKDGSRLSGLAGEEEDWALTFTRAGEASFSEQFLELEAAADNPEAVRILSNDAAELRTAFNEDVDKVRLLLLLAPSCPACQRGAREVRAKVLADIDDEGLKVYAVWEPILKTDSERAARKATTLLDDPRVEHFWVGTPDVGNMFREPIGLQGEPAWDVYLVYPRGVTWDGTPPKPDYFMHQLRGRLPQERLLDAGMLADRLRSLLQDE